MRRDPRVVLLLAATLGLGACDWWYDRVPSPDDLMHAVPWFDHMITQRNVHPYSRADIPRFTVDGTVPVTGGEPDWSAEWATGNATTADKLVNPTRGKTLMQEVAWPTLRQGTGLLPGEATGMGPATGARAAATADTSMRAAASPMAALAAASRHTGPAIPVIPGTIAARGDTLYGIFCEVCHGQAGDGKGPVGPKVGAPSLLTPRARGYTDGYLYSIIRYGRGVMPRYGDKVYEPADRWAVVNHVRKLQGQGGADSAAAPAAPAAPAAKTPGGQQ
ncbi:MAG TPA: cytochrome c [Gemmatimonadales bacterium]|nr:cytochrome c [Gemmatimonadales bacterium]